MTVVHHFVMLTPSRKQDQPLGTEFLKYIKAGGLRCFTLMNVAVLLAMNTIFRFENDVGVIEIVFS